MDYKSLFLNSTGKIAKKQLAIVGINPIKDYLISDPQGLASILETNRDLKITIIYESDAENFNQSLAFDENQSKNIIDYEMLSYTGRRRLLGNDAGRGGLLDGILNYVDKAEWPDIRSRVTMLQNNLRHTANIILADDVVRYCITTLGIPGIELYTEVTAETNEVLFCQLKDYVSFLLNPQTGGLYLSEYGEELIELYDNNDYPRGIYPRKAFYKTVYHPYSIWAFVFNRKGELLLHKRSEFTKINRGLWDKSAGGHVDQKDVSTILTAKREVVEELFLLQAEFTPYMSGKIKDFIDFGEWNVQKRPESSFRSGIEVLGESQWVVLRPIDRHSGLPMTIKRESPRIMHIPDLDENGNKMIVFDENHNPVLNSKGEPKVQEHIETWYTRFISDVFLFIAPEGCIDTDEQLHRTMALSESQGAASAHRVISIEELTAEVNANPESFTDDMVYMVREKRWLLTEFAEFVESI